MVLPLFVKIHRKPFFLKTPPFFQLSQAPHRKGRCALPDSTALLSSGSALPFPDSDGLFRRQSLLGPFKHLWSDKFRLADHRDPAKHIFIFPITPVKRAVFLLPKSLQRRHYILKITRYWLFSQFAHFDGKKKAHTAVPALPDTLWRC